MSVRSLTRDLLMEHDRLMEHLVEHVEAHGLDPDSEEVLDAVREIFGGEVRMDFEEWVE